MKKLNKHQEQLLSVISFALFGGEKSGEKLSLETLKEANLQAVLTLVSQDKGVLSDFYISHAQTLVNNVRIDYEHTEVHKLMTKAHIPYVILKGSASASYYPEPMLRTMGDVDFLVNPSDLKRTDKILRENGFSPIENNKHSNHLAYRRAGFGVYSTWELHWKPVGIPNSVIGTKIEKYLSDIIDTAYRRETVECEYMLPSPFHHGLVMLLHVAEHLTSTGIGLRHLCDWAVFAAKFSDEEFCKMFEDKLKTVGLWRFAQLLTQLSIKYLNCPQKEWCGKGDDTYLEDMIIDIMSGGNFGIKDSKRVEQRKYMVDARRGTIDDTNPFKQALLTINEKTKQEFHVVSKLPILFPVGWMYVVGQYLIHVLQGKRQLVNVKDSIAGAAERKEIYKEFRLFEAE